MNSPSKCISEATLPAVPLTLVTVLLGRALLGLKQKEGAEKAFKMAVELNKTHAEANEELVKLRCEALKMAGFDEETANKFAPKSRSVNEAIDHILSTSLTSDQLSKIRASYTRGLTNDNDNHFSGTESRFGSSSGIYGNKNLNKISDSKTNRDERLDTASESLGSKLIIDIDNCLGSILDSDEEKSRNEEFLEKIDNKLSATNHKPSKAYLNNNINTNSNNNFCDIGDNDLLSRSLSPQMSQNIFGISPDLHVNPIHQKPNSFLNFSIDLNKDSLGSNIIPKMMSNYHGSSSGQERPRKTFADIASANTKKPSQAVKMTQLISANSSFNCEYKPLQQVFDIPTKLSALESFSSGNSDSLDKIESFGGPPIVPTPEPTRPTNLMGYKGLWVCNISPNTSYITLRNVFKKYGNFTGLQTFERKATNGSNIVFVHYDNCQAPIDAIAELFGIYRKDICFDEKTLLKLRFTPSMEQTKNGELPSMEKARRVVERSGECFNWRLSTGCHKGDRCAFKHIAINKEIDSQPWVRSFVLFLLHYKFFLNLIYILIILQIDFQFNNYFF